MVFDREIRLRRWKALDQKAEQLAKEVQSLEEDEADLTDVILLGNASAKIQLRVCQEQLAQKRDQLARVRRIGQKALPKAKPRFRGTRKNGV